MASELVRNTGLGVELIESADWQVDDEPDQDAIYISFTIPSLPSAYSAAGNAPRNYISPILAGQAPSSDDFAKANEAMDYAKAKAAELRARAEYARGSNLEEAMRQAAFLEDGIATGTISAFNMPVVEALLARDLEAAIEAAGPTEEWHPFDRPPNARRYKIEHIAQDWHMAHPVGDGPAAIMIQGRFALSRSPLPQRRSQ